LEPAQAVAALGLDLSPDQKEVFHSLYDWMGARKSGTLTFGGYAGTGKTTLVSVLAKAFDPQRKIAFCALSGRAASVLRGKLLDIGIRTGEGTDHYCGTIHGLLYRAKTDRNGRIVGWMRNPSVQEYATIILDEASMVSEGVYKDLASEGVPILAVGDHGQLSPVEGRRDFGLMLKPQLTLTKIHRQAEGSPIIKLSQTIRETGGFSASVADKESIWVAGKSHLKTAINHLAKEPAEHLLDRAFLCYRNATRSQVNNLFRAARFGGSPPENPQQGELAICLKNSKNEGVYNGYRGVVTKTFKLQGEHHFKGSVDFPSENLTMNGARFSRWQWGYPKTFSGFDEMHEYGFSPSKWDQVGHLFDFGYCLTVHKAQGSQFSRVFIVVERPGPVDDDTFRRWLYTAVTRAEERVFLFQG
jgi:exodeoxyribonuclease-5